MTYPLFIRKSNSAKITNWLLTSMIVPLVVDQTLHIEQHLATQIAALGSSVANTGMSLKVPNVLKNKF